MAIVLDLTGQTFGFLTVEQRAVNDRWGNAHWTCRCKCGAIVIRSSAVLRRKHSIPTCGCFKRSAAPVRHGGAVGGKLTPEYRSWRSMKKRCFDTRGDKYEFYGGRGITVCDAWRNSFKQFMLDMGARPAGTTIDRIDPDGHYEPANCRWATKSTQVRNTRRNVWVTFRGHRMVLVDVAAATGMPYGPLWERIVTRGQSADVAIDGMLKRRQTRQ